MLSPPAREQDGADKIPLQFWKTDYLDVTKTKKNSCSTYHLFNAFFSVTTSNILTTDSKLYHVFFIFACLHSTLTQKPCQENFGKFQGSGKSRFGSSEKDWYFLKIPKWQHKLVQNYKWGKLVSYFLNNAAKTYLYGLKNFREHWN